MTRIRTLLATALVAGWLAPAAALACSCAWRDVSPAELVGEGHVIVRGEMIDVRSDTSEGFGMLVYRVRLLAAANADLPHEIEVRTPEHGATCGYRLQGGGPELLMLHGDAQSGYSVNSCSQYVLGEDGPGWDGLLSPDRVSGD